LTPPSGISKSVLGWVSPATNEPSVGPSPFPRLCGGRKVEPKILPGDDDRYEDAVPGDFFRYWLFVDGDR
ncbi:MAG: hypothetical protein ACK55S_08515, partial [Planctomycetota bacterium]